MCVCVCMWVVVFVVTDVALVFLLFLPHLNFRMAEYAFRNNQRQATSLIVSIVDVLKLVQ